VAGAQTPAQAARPGLTLVVSGPPGVTFDAHAIRAAIAREVERPVVLAADATARDASPGESVTVTFLDRRRVTIAYRDGDTEIIRVARVPVGAAAADVIALFVGNLTRDEARELLGGLHAPPAATPRVPGEPTPLDGAPAVDSITVGGATPPPVSTPSVALRLQPAARGATRRGSPPAWLAGRFALYGAAGATTSDGWWNGTDWWPCAHLGFAHRWPYLSIGAEFMYGGFVESRSLTPTTRASLRADAFMVSPVVAVAFTIEYFEVQLALGLAVGALSRDVGRLRLVAGSGNDPITDTYQVDVSREAASTTFVLSGRLMLAFAFRLAGPVDFYVRSEFTLNGPTSSVLYGSSSNWPRTFDAGQWPAVAWIPLMGGFRVRFGS
jgi:hypothetical protein